MGTEIDRLGGYSFRSTVTAGDGSNQKRGKMGAGYVNLRKQRKRQQRKMGREEEGSSSNHPELAAFVLALRGFPVTTFMPSFAGSPRCAFTLTRNVAGPAVVLFRSSLIASNTMSASGAPTYVAFPPSPTQIFTALVVAQIQHGFCHRGAA